MSFKRLASRTSPSASISSAFKHHCRSSTSPTGTSNTAALVTTHRQTLRITTKATSPVCWGRETPTLADGRDSTRRPHRWARWDRTDPTEARSCWAHRHTATRAVNRVDSQGEKWVLLGKIHRRNYRNVGGRKSSRRFGFESLERNLKFMIALNICHFFNILILLIF